MRIIVQLNFISTFTRRCVNSFVHRHSGEVIQTPSTPQEEEHVQVPRTFLERTVHDLNGHVQGCRAVLVLNLDEVGISEWEDRNTKRAIVATAMLDQMIYHGLSRNVKHISVIACGAAAGESLITYTVTSQNFSPVQKRLERHRALFGRDFILKSISRQSPFY
jgi:hypothetical protein